MTMKVLFDPETDTLSVLVMNGVVAESDEPRPGIILDYDANGSLLSVEILDASKHMPIPRQVEFEVTAKHVG
ncbi:MAG: DUF2283 domain-containing protein [Planctomycetia bacterium]|jgi:uncharacterized protein YuzE